MAPVCTPAKPEEAAQAGTASFRSRLGPIVLLSLIFFLNFLTRIILAPLLPALEQDLHLDHGEAGSLFLLISLGYCTSLLASGLVSSRLTHRKTIIFSAVAAGIPLIALCFGNQLWQIRIALVALGLATGLYLPSGIATLTSLIPPRHWGKGIAIHEVAPNLCAVVAPFISEALLPWVPWWGILALIGAGSAIVGVAFWRFGAGGRFPGQAPTIAAFQALLGERSFWAMTVLLSLAISASLGVYTMFPLYLVAERGIERSWANILVGLSRASGLVAVFLAGWAADRLGPRQVMRWVLLLTGTFTVLLGGVPGYWVAGMFFLQQLLAVCFFPAGFAALSAIGPTHGRNLAISLSIPIAFLAGGGVTPTIIGVMGDAGSFTGGFVLVGGLILLGFVICLRVRVPGENGCPAEAPFPDRR